MFAQKKRGEIDPQPCTDLSQVRNYDTGNCVYCDNFKIDDLAKYYPYNKNLTLQENCMNILSEIEKMVSSKEMGPYIPTISFVIVGDKAGRNSQQDRLSYYAIRNMSFPTIEKSNDFLAKRWQKIKSFLGPKTKYVFNNQSFKGDIIQLSRFDEIISEAIKNLITRQKFVIDVKHGDKTSTTRIEFQTRTIEDLSKDAELVIQETKRLEQLLKAAPKPMLQRQNSLTGMTFDAVPEKKNNVFQISGYTVTVDEPNKRFNIKTKDGMFDKTMVFNHIYLPTRETPYLIAEISDILYYLGPSIDTRNDYYVLYKFYLDGSSEPITFSKGDFAPLGPIVKTPDKVYFLTRGRMVPRQALLGRTFSFDDLMRITDIKNNEESSRMDRIVWSFYDARSNRHLY